MISPDSVRTNGFTSTSVQSSWTNTYHSLRITSAAAGLDLRLHHHGPVDRHRRREGARGCGGDLAGWHRNAVTGEEIPGLVLEQIQRAALLWSFPVGAKVATSCRLALDTGPEQA